MNKIAIGAALGITGQNSDANIDGQAKEASSAIYKDTKTLSLASIRLIKLLVLVLIFITLGEFFAYFFVMPMFSQPQVEFIGNTKLSSEVLEDVISSKALGNWLGFSKKTVIAALSRISGIASVKIHKTSPGHIAVYVTERVPCALTTIEEDGRTVLVCIDRNGVLFRGKDTTSLNLPLITGLPIESDEGNTRVPLIYRDIFTNIEALLALNPACFAPISELRVQPKKYGNYELILYPVKGNTKVYLDRFINQATWQYVLITLDIAQSMNPSPEYIDLRYGAVSFKP